MSIERTAVAGFVAALTALAAAQPAHAADVQRGRLLYERRCFACHSVDANRIGPLHQGVIGRRAGGVADYDYSPALKGARIVWDEANLERWLADPEKLIPGQRMGYRVEEAADRADIVAYLSQVSGR
jgi:cytochrome c